MKKKLKKNLFAFIVVTILLCIPTVYAINKIYATSVSIDITNISELSNGSTLDDALTGLYDRIYSTICPEGYKCYEKKSTPEVGDYVQMTPTLSSYTTDTMYTGYTSTQTINPKELNLWRVIKVNDNGTIEMVSENVSSTGIYFKGQTGYKNLVGYLNVLASKYENSQYTTGSRHMGYNGQTEYLTDTANTVDSTNTTAPWTSNTGNNTVESQGGGDMLYENDATLVKNAVGKLNAYNPSGQSAAYWVASRAYVYSVSSSYTNWGYYDHQLMNDGTTQKYGLYIYSYGNFYSSSLQRALRPIVVLKSGINYTPASGIIDDPFVLN